MSEWKLQKLGDVAEIVGGGTPSSKKDEYYGGNVPWITPKDLSGYSYKRISKGSRNITQIGLEKSSAKLLPKNSVLFTSRAPIGYVAIADAELATNQGFKSLVLKGKQDPDFYYYLLKHNVDVFESRASGSTFKEVSGKTVKETELLIPDYDTQLSISGILNPIDKKIELNTQTNQTLEQIAQAIFKSWFVDFEPVKAKMAVLEAGLPAPVRISGGPREGIFCTYVIECDDGSYYIGQTDNLKRRWREHLSGKGAQWTKTHKPLQIAHFEENSSREEAAAKEKNWKTTSGRRELKKLIASGAARQAGGTAEQAELAAMSVISAKDEAALKQLQAEQPDAYAELAQTAALFPSALVDSELGEIPEGWEVVKTEQLAETIAMGPFGSNIKVSTFVDSGVPIISGHHLKETLVTEGNHNFITEEHATKLKNSCVTRGDIVFTHAGNIGQVSLIPESTIYDKYVISQRQFYLRTNRKKASPYFLVFFFKSNYGQHILLSNASQVGVPSIARPSSHLKNIELIKPSFELMEKFELTCKSLLNGVVANRKESQELSEIRDTLLPKLLAGHLPITNTEVA